MQSAEILNRLEAVHLAARKLRSSSTAKRNQVLKAAAELLKKKSHEILQANEFDLKELDSAATSAFRDRLLLNASRIQQMRDGLLWVAKLPDSVGEVVEKRSLKNGLKVKRVRSPLGVILMIFESRPNVAVEAFSLGFKSGNAMILRGGKESMRTTRVLYEILTAALTKASLPADCLWGITDPDRAITEFLLQQKQSIDVVVPRGGDGLINFVTSHSRIPVIKNDRGLCHVYVHSDANLDMATKIVINAKTQRPGVCNSMETLLVHRKVAAKILPKIYEASAPFALEWFCDEESALVLSGKGRVEQARPESWNTEYLDFKMNCRVVDSLEDAVQHIEKHGSRHSETIVTKSATAAREFQSQVDAAAVYWNASTRFTDGFELGLGGELGISTQKLHVRGPVGLRELTSVRWVIDGKGQIR